MVNKTISHKYRLLVTLNNKHRIYSESDQDELLSLKLRKTPKMFQCAWMPTRYGEVSYETASGANHSYFGMPTILTQTYQKLDTLILFTLKSK